MLRLTTQTLFKMTAGAALALMLAACGGDGGSDHASPAAGQQASTATGFTAYTVPGWTSFPMEIARDADDKETLILPDPTLGSQQVSVKSRDAMGNITELADDGPFTDVVSLQGNRIGMLCGRDRHFKKADSHYFDISSAHYAYLSDEFTEVDHREVYGKTFRIYLDCEDEGLTKIDAEGFALDLDEESPEPYSIAPLFAQHGVKDGSGPSATITRNKAFKRTVNGQTTYVMVDVAASDPDVPGTDPAEQSVGLAVSQ